MTIIVTWIRILIPNVDPDPEGKMNVDPCGAGSYKILVCNFRPYLREYISFYFLHIEKENTVLLYFPRYFLLSLPILYCTTVREDWKHARGFVQHFLLSISVLALLLTS